MRYYDPAAKNSPITEERARIMSRAIDAGADCAFLAREFNTTSKAVQKAVMRYRRARGRVVA